MDAYQQFLKAVQNVAQQVETPAEAFNLIEWIRATVPDATDTEYEPHITLLSACAEYWGTYGCYEDELMPALAILHTYCVFNYPTSDELAHIVRIQSRCDDMLAEPDFDAPDMTYEEFCDKYAAELNH